VRIDKVTFRFIHDPAAQAAVQAGDIDMFFNFATHSVSRFLGDSRYQVLIGSSSGKGMLAINHRRKPLDDVRVRRAITHAIDREAFIRDVLEGRGKAIGSHFSPTDAGYVHLAGMYPYDPDRARVLLREAGVKTPLELTLTLPPTPYATAPSRASSTSRSSTTSSRWTTRSIPTRSTTSATTARPSATSWSVTPPAATPASARCCWPRCSATWRRTR